MEIGARAHRLGLQGAGERIDPLAAHERDDLFDRVLERATRSRTIALLPDPVPPPSPMITTPPP
jgi:hypothetical protein